MKKIITCLLIAAALLVGTASPASAATMSPLKPEGQPMMAVYHVSDAEIDMLAQLVWGEARGVKSKAEQAAVVWCVLNRVDDDRWGGTIEEVVTQSAQFCYNKRFPVKAHLRELAEDVVGRWVDEKLGGEDVGRVLPREYCFFAGRDGHNWFRMQYEGDGTYWDWSLPDPYHE